MATDVYKQRKDRNLNILELKRQEIEKRFEGGQITIDVPGTIREMSANTILALPQSLRETGKLPTKKIKVRTYDKAGEDRKLLKERDIRLQHNEVDLDEALSQRLRRVQLSESSSPDEVNLPEFEDTPVAEKPAPTLKEETHEIGRVVRKPKAKTQVSQSDTEEVLEYLRTLMGN